MLSSSISNKNASDGRPMEEQSFLCKKAPQEDKYHLPVPCFSGGSVVKSLWQAETQERCGFDPWVGKWQSTPVFLPGKPHGQESLAGYSPWGCKESDMTERLTHTMLFNSGKPWSQVLALPLACCVTLGQAHSVDCDFSIHPGRC